MAFAYTYLPSLSDDDRNCIRRRLRVNTVQLGVARDRKQLYADADPNVVLCLLSHTVRLLASSPPPPPSTITNC